MAINPEELSQFTWIDTDELHLVGMSANGVPEPLLAKTADVGHVIKANDEDRFLLMVAYSPHRMPLRGKDGRTDLASPAVLEKACWAYMAKGACVGMWHEPGHENAAIVTENGIYRGPDWDVHGNGSLVVKAGDWLVGMILSPDAWNLYKSGRISGVSMQGRAGRKPATPKAIARAEGKSTVKKNKVWKQLEKSMRQSYPSTSSPHVTGVDLSGGQSTIANSGTASRIVSSFLAGLEQRVSKAKGEVAMAGSALEKMRATSDLQTSLRQRYLGKMVVQEGIRADRSGAPPASRFGTAIFAEGSTYSLPADDADVGYTGRAGEAVR